MGELTKPQEEKRSTVRQMLVQNLGRIRAAVPQHVKAETICRTLIGALEKTPKLLNCTESSLWTALMEAAQLGVEIGDSVTGEAYLIPYGDEAKLQVSYKGIKSLCRRAGEANLDMQAVFEGDKYEFTNRYMVPVHTRSKDRNRRSKPVTHAYAVVIQKDGSGVLCESWTVEECIAHRDQYSKGWKGALKYNKEKDHPWHEEHPQFYVMCAKTVLWDLVHRGDVPLSSEARQIVRDTDNIIQATVNPTNEVAPAPAAQIEQAPPEGQENAPEWRSGLRTELANATTRDACKAIYDARQQLCKTVEECDQLIGIVDDRIAQLRDGEPTEGLFDTHPEATEV